MSNQAIGISRDREGVARINTERRQLLNAAWITPVIATTLLPIHAHASDSGSDIPPPDPFTDPFCMPDDCTIEVPPGVSSINIIALGAAGEKPPSGVGVPAGLGGPGGEGGTHAVTISVIPGDILDITVGAEGAGGVGGTADNTSRGGPGGAGGGASSVYLNGTLIARAGGGGGGGGHTDSAFPAIGNSGGNAGGSGAGGAGSISAGPGGDGSNGDGGGGGGGDRDPGQGGMGGSGLPGSTSTGTPSGNGSVTITW